jgi:hypothetical protein
MAVNIDVAETPILIRRACCVAWDVLIDRYRPLDYYEIVI